MRATLHTHAAALPERYESTGSASIGVVLRSESGDVIGEIARSIDATTIRVAEYRALIEGLVMALDRGVTDVNALFDSTSLEGHLLRGHRVGMPHLIPLVERVHELLDLFSTSSLTRVPRALRALNTHADQPANLGIDKAIGTPSRSDRRTNSEAAVDAGMNRTPGDELRVKVRNDGHPHAAPGEGRHRRSSLRHG